MKSRFLLFAITLALIAVAMTVWSVRALIERNTQATASIESIDENEVRSSDQLNAQTATLVEQASDFEMRSSVAIEAPPQFHASNVDPIQQLDSQVRDADEITTLDLNMQRGHVGSIDRSDFGDVRTIPAWLSDGGDLDLVAHQESDTERNWRFGWISIAPDANTLAIKLKIRNLGGELLGEPSLLTRSRLPADVEALANIVAIEGVRGVGTPPIDRKVSPSLMRKLDESTGNDTFPAFVTLMEHDADGRWGAALSSLGAMINRYDPTIHVYVANVPSDAVNTIASSDFVMAIEPIDATRALHDTAVPAMGADAVRVFNASTRSFAGVTGATVPIGVMDSGLNTNHNDIGRNRRSICGANFAALINAREEDADLWVDAGMHGTHVTGTILGNGMENPRYAGVAPGVRDIRVAKVLNRDGAGDVEGILRGMDFLAQRTSCGGHAAKVSLVNASLGKNGTDWQARSTAERKLDAMVWNHRQLYIVANANDGSFSYSDLAAAKNSLGVGAIRDNGDIAHFSSHGPTRDGRLTPLVVGTGVDVWSTHGDGRRQAYASFSGTSQAAPAVAGVAALLMDAERNFRERPAAVRARLMASAIKPDAFLADRERFPATNTHGPGDLQHRYGLGKVSARTSILTRNEPNGWLTGATSVDLRESEYGWYDIYVPANASRLDVVATWDEPPADTHVQPVLNDFDLWVDRHGDCPTTASPACGEASSQSRRDNVEWVVMTHPASGAYRLKIVPNRTYGDTPPRIGLAWTIIRGESTPQLAIQADTDRVSVRRGRSFDVDLRISNDSFVAAGTTLRIDCHAENADTCSRLKWLLPKQSWAMREDNIERTLDYDMLASIALGEVAVGEEQAVSLKFLPNHISGPYRLYFTVTAWNGKSASTSIIVDDGKEPIPPLLRPPLNDSYANAESLVGSAGTASLDLLLATAEPGEPPFLTSVEASTERPRSVWYAWTAPDSTNYRFSIDAGSERGIADEIGMELFVVDGHTPVASLQSSGAKIGGGLTFAATRGHDYRLRIGIVDASFQEMNFRRITEPLTLRWSRHTPPANDHFNQATTINGEQGTVAGSNLGASLEQNELVSSLAATTWFRWTAPKDGIYVFAVDRRNLAVAAFTGNDVADLRLVSALPDSTAIVRAFAGDVFRILIAAQSAETSGNEYTLSWFPDDPGEENNDNLASAETIPGDQFSYELVANFNKTTVQPLEPIETGVRTAWWSWTAPESGVYTWRTVRDRFDAGTYRINMWRITDLERYAERLSGNDPTRTTDFAFSITARKNTKYLLSVGMPTEAPFVAPPRTGAIRLEWGRAPANDNLASATALRGASGTVSGSNNFATVERDEQTGRSGDLSLWWTWNAPTRGWYHFSLANTQAGILTVFRRGPGGSLNLLAISRRNSGTEDVVFRAEVGTTYVVRLGTQPPYAGEDFTLSWTKDVKPAWLGFVDLIEDGDVDASANPIYVVNIQSMAFHPTGRYLYMVTGDGLQILERSTADGSLRQLQSIADVDNLSVLLWHENSASLIAFSCLAWRAFTPTADGANLSPARYFKGISICPQGSVFTDSTGSILVAPIAANGLEVVRINVDDLTLQQLAFIRINGLTAATLAKSANVVYAAAENALQVFSLDEDTGSIELLVTIENGMRTDSNKVVEGLSGVYALVADERQNTLFAFGSGGSQTVAFDLTDPENPRFVDTLPSFTSGSSIFFANINGGINVRNSPNTFFPIKCRHATIRPDRLVADVLCPRRVFTVQLLNDETLRAEDDFVWGGVDRYDNDIPYADDSQNFVASPDGRHLYVTTGHAIMIIERTPSN